MDPPSTNQSSNKAKSSFSGFSSAIDHQPILHISWTTTKYQSPLGFWFEQVCLPCPSDLWQVHCSLPSHKKIQFFVSFEASTLFICQPFLEGHFCIFIVSNEFISISLAEVRLRPLFIHENHPKSCWIKSRKMES